QNLGMISQKDLPHVSVWQKSTNILTGLLAKLGKRHKILTGLLANQVPHVSVWQNCTKILAVSR
ncbi:MAG: hypothetical protein ACKPKO_15305, partial [Candidatus Fonsibacter sp.]